jgi:hypothetical protein
MGNSQESGADLVPFFDSDTFLSLHHCGKKDNYSDSVVGSGLKRKLGRSCPASLAEVTHASNRDAVDWKVGQEMNQRLCSLSFP